MKRQKIQASEAAAQNPRSRSRKKRRPGLRERLFRILPAAAILIIFAAAWVIVNKKDVYTLRADGASYYLGSVFRIKEGTKFERKPDGTLIRVNEPEAVIKQPIYYTGETALLIPNEMVWYDPRTGNRNTVPALSEVVFDRGNVTVKNGENEKFLSGGFLFDGADIYIFLEDMHLRLNDMDIKLPALSYAEATREGEINYYCFGSDQSGSAPGIGLVNVHPEWNEYTVSLKSDSMTDAEGTHRLLLINTSLAAPLF